MYLKKTHNRSTIYGWDIGGAHLKVCQMKIGVKKGTIQAIQLKCKLWKGPKHLVDAIKKVSEYWGFKNNDRHFFTMSGEMVDYFPSRKDGVESILKILDDNFKSKIYCYSQNKFLEREEFFKSWESIASANWHATTNYVSSQIENGILVDIGSTTTDLIPFKNNMTIRNTTTSDYKRLQTGELVYLGVTRTLVSSIKPQLNFRNIPHNVMREAFANTADIFRITNDLSKKSDMYPTCDNGSKTVTASEKRLARVIGMDKEDASSDEWKSFAHHIKLIIIQELVVNITQIKRKFNIPSDYPLVLTGSGAFLGKALSAQIKSSYIMFDELLKDNFDLDPLQKTTINSCAPAVSLCLLAKKNDCY